MGEKNTIVIHSILNNINDIENKLLNAIERYNKALEACNLERYPDTFALIQNNLGIAYVKLASIKDAEKNLIKAINAYKEALKIRTIKTHPLKYFLLQKAIGDAYYQLSLFKEALDAYQRFLQIEREMGGFLRLHEIYLDVKNKIRMAINQKEKSKW